MARGSTGVELRFILKGDRAVIKMSCASVDGRFHIYRGGIQGSWYDHENHKVVLGDAEEFEVKKPEEPEKIKIMHEKLQLDWDSDVVRIIFDKGIFNIYDIVGDIEPPKPEQCPKQTMLCYGSSITHGSNALDMSHAWASVLGYNLNVDVRNLGMAGSCFMELEFVDYIASEGEKGNWDLATLELGVNVLGWDKNKFRTRIKNTIYEIAHRNADKPIFVISPFYLCAEDFEKECKVGLWRDIIEDVVKELGLSNVIYINGLNALGDMSGISANLIHPNIYGVQCIADYLTETMKAELAKRRMLNE